MQAIVSGLLLACTQADPSLSEDLLRVMQSSYRELAPYQLSYRIAERFDGPRDALLRSFGVPLDEYPVVDPESGTELWFLTICDLAVDPIEGSAVLRTWFSKGGNRPPVQAMQRVQMFQQDRYAVVQPNIADKPADLYDSSRTTRGILQARGRGDSSVSSLPARAEFTLAVQYSLRHLPNATDLAVTHLDSRVGTLRSRALGIECSVDRESGECLSVTMTSPGGRYVTMGVLDRFDEAVFPAHAPSLVRKSSNLSGEEVVSLIAYDSVPEFRYVDSSEFDWRAYSDTAIDRNRNVLVHADGTESLAPPDRNEKMWKAVDSSLGNLGQIDPLKEDNVEFLSRSLEPRPTSLLPPILFVSGSVMVVGAAVITIRRRSA